MKILICSVLVLAGFVSAYSQEKLIDASEFDAVNQTSANPVLRWKGRSFRMTVLTETHADRGPATDYTSKSLTEFGSGGETRSVWNSSFGGKAAESTESVKAGGVRYVRKGNAAWTRTDAAAPPAKAPDEPPAAPYELVNSQVEYKFLGTELFKNKKARTYLKTENRTSAAKADGATVESVTTTKYWFDEDGTLLKSDFRSNSTKGDRKTYTGVVIEWELDPSINIAPPPIP